MIFCPSLPALNTDIGRGIFGRCQQQQGERKDLEQKCSEIPDNGRKRCINPWDSQGILGTVLPVCCTPHLHRDLSDPAELLCRV